MSFRVLDLPCPGEASRSVAGWPRRTSCFGFGPPSEAVFAVVRWACVWALLGCSRAPTPAAASGADGGRKHGGDAAGLVARAGVRAQAEGAETRYEVERAELMVGASKFSLHLPRGRVAPLPSVLVLHSALGRTESVLGWCDRLAQQGFAALAFDFYDGQLPASREEAFKLRDAANARAMDIRHSLEATYVALGEDPRLQARQRFLLGWSFGAAWATAASGFLPDVTGVVAFYGETFSTNPALYDQIHAPLLLVAARGDSDAGAPQLRAIASELQAKGKRADLIVSEGQHGFAERAHPNYDAKAAEVAWSGVQRFLTNRKLEP